VIRPYAHRDWSAAVGDVLMGMIRYCGSPAIIEHVMRRGQEQPQPVLGLIGCSSVNMPRFRSRLVAGNDQLLPSGENIRAGNPVASFSGAG